MGSTSEVNLPDESGRRWSWSGGFQSGPFPASTKSDRRANRQATLSVSQIGRVALRVETCLVGRAYPSRNLCQSGFIGAGNRQVWPIGDREVQLAAETANRRLGPTGQSICSDIQLVRDLQDGEAFGYASCGGKKAKLALYIVPELVSDGLWRLALVKHP